MGWALYGDIEEAVGSLQCLVQGLTRPLYNKLTRVTATALTEAKSTIPIPA
jgi:hypothetical protein